MRRRHVERWAFTRIELSVVVVAVVVLSALLIAMASQHGRQVNQTICVANLKGNYDE